MLDFFYFKNVHKNKPGLVIGHGPSSGTVTKAGHQDGPDGFEYNGAWDDFRGIKFSCHYREYNSDYTVSAEYMGIRKEEKWLQDGEVKFVGGIDTAIAYYGLGKFQPDSRYIYVPFIRNWYYDNTGNLAWWIAFWMGCNPIYLAGLDYTLTDKGKEYNLAGYVEGIKKNIYHYMRSQGRQVFIVDKGRLNIPVKNPLED